LADLDLNTVHSISNEERVILEEGVFKLKLVVWVDKQDFSDDIKQVLSEFGVNSVGDLCDFTAKKVSITNTILQHCKVHTYYVALES